MIVRRRKNIIKIFATFILAVSMVGTTVNAAGSSYSGMAADSVATTSFTKDLEIPNDCNIPGCAFSFAITVGSSVSGTGTTFPINAGIEPDKVKFTPEGDATTKGSGTITYLPNTKATAVANDYVTIKEKTPDDDYYTAQKKMTLDFSGVTFTKPGVYRYIITESGTNSGIINDTVNTRTLDVYVEDASTATAKKLKITNYLLYKDTDKSTGFQNTLDPSTLTFGKEVKGNQGSLDKYFKYTLTIERALAGTVFNVDVSAADTSISEKPNDATTCIPAGGATNATSLTADSNGSVTADFYLQDGQYITVNGLTVGMSYEITEDEEDYTSTEGISAEDSPFNIDGIGGNDALTGKTSDTITTDGSVIYTGFTNTRRGVVPTGVLLSIAGLVVAAIFIVAGVIFFGIRSRRKYEE